jgi:hypothetical protein
MKDYNVQGDIVKISTDAGRDEIMWYNLVKDLKKRYGEHFRLELESSTAVGNKVSELEFRIIHRE